MGLMNPSEAVISDRWASGRSTPELDTQRNVEIISGGFDAGVLTFSFERPLVSPDTSKDIDLTTDSCVYFLTAKGNTNNYQPQYHLGNRDSSSVRFCFNNCPKHDDGSASGEPHTQPMGEPTSEPEGEPHTTPEGEPHTEPVGEPTTEPVGEPTTEPEGEPTTEPEGEPTTEPEGEPSPNPCEGTCNKTQGCIFDVHWKHNRINQSLVFTITDTAETGQYLALGFSLNQLMVSTPWNVKTYVHEFKLIMNILFNLKAFISRRGNQTAALSFIELTTLFSPRLISN